MRSIRQKNGTYLINAIFGFQGFSFHNFYLITALTQFIEGFNVPIEFRDLSDKKVIKFSWPL